MHHPQQSSADSLAQGTATTFEKCLAPSPPPPRLPAVLLPAASLARPHIWKAPLYSHVPRPHFHEFGSAVISNSCPYQLKPRSCCFSPWKGVWKTEEESQPFFTLWSQKMLSLAPQCEKQWWLEHAPRNMAKASLLKKGHTMGIQVSLECT